MELIRKSDAIRAVLHNEGQAAVAAVQAIRPINPHGELREMLIDEMIDRANRPMNNEELIKALLCKSNDINDCTMCSYHNPCYCGTLEEIAADALEAAEKRIAELEAQLPKEGEWIDENRRTRSSKFVCSTCKRTCYDIQPTRDKAWTKRCRYNYCPNCGAKMNMKKGKQE